MGALELLRRLDMETMTIFACTGAPPPATPGMRRCPSSASLRQLKGSVSCGGWFGVWECDGLGWAGLG